MHSTPHPTMKHPVLAALLLSLVVAGIGSPTPAAGQAGATGPGAVPVYEVDPTWPRALPDNWIIGLPLGIYVDSRDRVWVVQNAGTLAESELGAAQDPPTAECCVPAAPLLVFDQEGNVVKTWGGPGEGYEWPSWSPERPSGGVHGVFVDHNDFVWIGTHNQHQVLKFTLDGQHVLTIGDPHTTGGSNDPEHLGGPAGLYVDPETNELFVADGYVNRRMIVFDAATGEYRRHWGAYGKRPDDDYRPGPRGAAAPPSEQFSTPHGVIGSRDGLIYVADRSNSRIQVFRRSGEFVMERRVAPATLGSGSAFAVALSRDPEQRYLYLADGTNNKVRILLRKGLEPLGEFGRGGRQIGQFTRVHNLAIDSRGNLYTTEAADGRRLQRFLLRTGAR